MNVFRVFVLALIVGLTAHMFGCSVHGPRVGAHEALWADATDDATVLNIELELQNPGGTTLEVQEMHYRVSIGQQNVYNGRRSIGRTLSPKTSARITVPAVIVAEDADALAASLAQGYAISGNVVYISPGRLALIRRDLGLPRPRAPFRGAGDVLLGAQPIE